MYNMWKSIYALNLSNNNDKDFKLAQILESRDMGLIFDVRQTYKGRKTKAGITLLVPEFDWFKTVLVSNEKKKNFLEYGNRRILIDNTLDDVLICLKRSDDSERKVLIGHEEMTKLLDNINEIENKLIGRALELEIPTKFSEFNYINKYVV